MSTIELKIVFPPGNRVKSNLIKVKQTSLVKEVIAETVKSNKLSNPEQYALLLPPPSSEMNALWLEEGRLLSTYPLQPKDTLELRKLNQVIKIYFRRGYQRILVNINQPLEKVIPLIAKKFQLDNIKEFTLHLRKNGTLVDYSKSIREQRIYTDAIFTLKKSGEELEEVEEEEEEDKEEEEEETPEASKQENDENQEPHDQRAAKSHKNAQKMGPLKAKRDPKKKFEERYFVLKDSYLYEYKSSNVKQKNKPAFGFNVGLMAFSLK